MASDTSSDLQKLAYDALSTYFQQHEDEVVEIEILPPAIEPPDGIMMQDGRSLGVPKKILALAFLEARRVFFSNTSADENDIKVWLKLAPSPFTLNHLSCTNHWCRPFSPHESSYCLIQNTW
jgi:hypothetical protein